MAALAKYWCLLLAFSACAFSVDVCPAPSASLCTSVPRNQTARFKCGVPGKLQNPDPIGDGCQTPTFEACRDACVFDPHCFTFSFKQTDVVSGFCTRYQRSVSMQSFQKKPKSNTKFWSTHCFKQSCPNLDCPSDNFQVQVAGSKYDGQYLMQLDNTATFTADVTEASYYHLNNACNLVRNSDPELIGNAMAASPFVTAGPIYFNEQASITAQGYNVPTCKFQQKTPSLSCQYDATTGNETYACQIVLSLPGPYPGDSICGNNAGDLSLTGVNFVTADTSASTVKRDWWG